MRKVVLAAQLLELPFERIDAGAAYGIVQTPDYQAKNPNALIPTIEDNDVALWESNAITRYLAAKHGGEVWWPSDPAARAKADKWMDWQVSLASAQHGAFINLVRRKPEERDPAAIAESARRAAKLMTIVDEQLSRQPWLSGETLGIGDVPVGVYAHTFFTLEIDRPELPHLRAWYERLTARKSYSRTVMIPLT